MALLAQRNSTLTQQLAEQQQDAEQMEAQVRGPEDRLAVVDGGAGAHRGGRQAAACWGAGTPGGQAGCSR